MNAVAGLLAELERRPLVLDAGMGTRLVARGLDLARDDPALWNLTRPADVLSVHALDVAAGADALVANTFGANRPWLRRFGRAGEVRRVIEEAVRLAQEAAGAGRFVLGSIGPAAVGESGACREAAEALVGAGVDALLLETFRAEGALAALAELGRGLGVPVFVSLCAWPEPMGETVSRLESAGAAAFGCNCVARETAVAWANKMALLTRLPLLVKPSAGLPGAALDAAADFAAAVPAWLASGVRLIGGCCGTTEAHVAAVRAACYDP